MVGITPGIRPAGYHPTPRRVDGTGLAAGAGTVGNASRTAGCTFAAAPEHNLGFPAAAAVANTVGDSSCR